MHFHKFMQCWQIDKHRKKETVERHKGQDRHPHGKFYKEEHQDCQWQHQGKESLQFRQDQDVESQQFLRELLEPGPAPGAKDLDEALVPARALLDELLDSIW